MRKLGGNISQKRKKIDAAPADEMPARIFCIAERNFSRFFATKSKAQRLTHPVFLFQNL